MYSLESTFFMHIFHCACYIVSVKAVVQDDFPTYMHQSCKMAMLDKQPFTYKLIFFAWNFFMHMFNKYLHVHCENKYQIASAKPLVRVDLPGYKNYVKLSTNKTPLKKQISYKGELEKAVICNITCGHHSQVVRGADFKPFCLSLLYPWRSKPHTAYM